MAGSLGPVNARRVDGAFAALDVLNQATVALAVAKDVFLKVTSWNGMEMRPAEHKRWSRRTCSAR